MVLIGRLLPLALAWVGLRATQGLFDEEVVEDGRCTNTCRFARDGVCDDQRALGLCPDGTDCQDCGPWNQSNFTEVPIAVVVADDAPHRSGIQLKRDDVTQLYQSSKDKLILEGEGFPTSKEAQLEFGFGGPKVGTFSCSTLSETQLEVTLLDDNKWAHQGGPLFLLKAKFGDAEGDEEEVDYTSPGLKVATVLDDPSVSESHLHAYASHTKHITIQGMGFLSTFNFHVKPQVRLSPTLAGDYVIKEDGWTYETVTISLSTDPEAMWAIVRDEDKTVEVKVVSIDTGGGQIYLPGGGVVVAEVRMDDGTFNCDDSCVYANDGQCDEEQVHIMVNAPSCPLGTDCTDCGIKLGGVTIAEMQADKKGHSLSVEAHEEVSMYQSSKVLTIAGEGFNTSYTRFRFANSLVEVRNFTQTLTPGSATFTLKEGSKWRQDAPAWPAPLVLLAADAGDGFVPVGATTAKPWRKVATIYEDPRLEPSLQEIGRTLTHEFYLRGTGFTKAFPPIVMFDHLADLEAPIDREAFMVQVVNRTAVKLSLTSFGGGWMPRGETGNLRVRAINTGGGMYTMEEPVPIAVVVADDAPQRSGIQFKPDYVTQLYQVA